MSPMTLVVIGLFSMFQNNKTGGFQMFQKRVNRFITKGIDMKIPKELQGVLLAASG